MSLESHSMKLLRAQNPLARAPIKPAQHRHRTYAVYTSDVPSAGKAGHCGRGSKSLARQTYDGRCTAKLLLASQSRQGVQVVRSSSREERSSNPLDWQLPFYSPRMSDPWAALLMAWHASRGGSLLAAQCLVEAALQLHLQGTSFTEIQIGLKLATLGGGSSASGSMQLLSEQDEAMLLSWVALVIIAAQEVGVVPSAPSTRQASLEDEQPSASSSSPIQGDDPLTRGQKAAHQALGMLRDRQAADSSSSSSSSGGGGGGRGDMVNKDIEPGGLAYQQLDAENKQLKEENKELQDLNRRLEAENRRLQEENQALVRGGASAGPSTRNSEEASRRLEEEVAGSLQSRRYLEGMRGFALQALEMYFKEGYSLSRLISWQATVSHGVPQGSAQYVMQQYTRIVILTLDVLASQGRVQAPHEQQEEAGSYLSSIDHIEPSSVTPLNYLASFSSVAGSIDVDDQASDSTRPLALRLLIGFMGAVLGSPYSAAKFVEGVCLAYSEGWTAAEIMEVLSERDFVQSGGLVTSDAGSGGRAAEINRELFVIWLSTVYMVLARMGAVFPRPVEGYAWAGEDPVQAIGLNQFVENALQQCEVDRQKSLEAGTARGAQGTGPALEDTPDDPFLARLRSDATVARLLDEERQAAALQYLMDGTLDGKELPDSLMRIEDKELPMNSAAYRLIRAQSDLVTRTYALASALRQNASLVGN